MAWANAHFGACKERLADVLSNLPALMVRTTEGMVCVLACMPMGSALVRARYVLDLRPLEAGLVRIFVLAL